MRLSTRGRFAINAMIDLALRQPDCPVALSELAARHGISLSYLEQVFAKLRQHGLVESTRGPGGGYQLARERALISVADVIDAVDETVDATRCGGKRNCKGEKGCITHDLWAGLSEQIRQHLANVSLENVCQNAESPDDVHVIKKWPMTGAQPTPSAT